MDFATLTLVIGLFFGVVLGTLFGTAIQRDRLRIVKLACAETTSVLQKRLDSARDELFASWKEADDQAGYYRSELARLENARAKLDAEVDRLSLRAVTAESRLRRANECAGEGCSEKLRHDQYCFTCGLHKVVAATEYAAEAERAVA